MYTIWIEVSYWKYYIKRIRFPYSFSCFFFALFFNWYLDGVFFPDTNRFIDGKYELCLKYECLKKNISMLLLVMFRLCTNQELFWCGSTLWLVFKSIFLCNCVENANFYDFTVNCTIIVHHIKIFFYSQWQWGFSRWEKNFQTYIMLFYFTVRSTYFQRKK
jgi:hypothetical protein